MCVKLESYLFQQNKAINMFRGISIPRIPSNQMTPINYKIGLFASLTHSLTHRHSDAVDGSAAVDRILVGFVGEELEVVEIPLDGVDLPRQPVTPEHRVLAPLDVLGHHQTRDGGG